MGEARDTAALRGELARLVGAEHVLGEGEVGTGGFAHSHYQQDGTAVRGLRGRADLVVKPGSAAEVAAVLGLCYAHDVPLIPRGGGTGLAGGAVPLDGGVVCSLERLRAIRELEPGLWRMYPEAGVGTRDVQRLARENGLCFPPDPGASEQSQIGGNVATNAGGPHAFKYGVTGNWVTGLEAVLAPGELIAIGGAHRKDVAGYDLKGLLIGSEGTLGIITAVRLRLAPAPAAALALLAFQRTREQGCAAILDVLAAGVLPAALDFLDGETLRIAAGAWEGGPGAGGQAGRCASGPLILPAETGFALLAEVDGTLAEARAAYSELAAALAPTALELRQLDPDALWRWRDRVSGAVAAVRGGKVGEDIVVPVERLAEALEGFAAIAARNRLPACAWGHGADGNIHANLLIDPRSEADLAAAERAAEELFALAVKLGGSVSGEHGMGWLKRGQLARQWPPQALALHEQIKRAFDPKGLLNPGKKLAKGPE
jgi:glycolate oxidase subunit GlcD